jgi:CheY-like chemotaxis protein
VAGAPAPILIVEDNRDTREALERILGIRGYAFVSTSGARAALDYLDGGGTAAAIVLDLEMPGMDGRAFLDRVRSHPSWARIPVVVFSCDPSGAPDVAARVRKGSDDPDVLLDALAACWERGSHR